MKKILTVLFVIISLFTIQANTYGASIDKTISASGINKGAVSVSVKDVKTGKTVYKLNENQPNMPASTLKMITLAASLDTLGSDYEFKTQLYKNTNNELILKLGADPFLRSSNLKELISAAKAKKIISPKAVYIDDFVLDSTEWGEGWQWDDDLNPLMPKFSSYNLDGNLLKIIIAPTSKGAPANIYTAKFYPTTFMNLVTTGDENDINISRNNSISPDLLTVEGTVKGQITKQIPINHPKRYFILRLEDAIRDEKLDYYGKFAQKKTPSSNVYLVSEVTHPIEPAIEQILKNSNNFVAETVFKIAGGQYVKNTGSLANSLKMLNAYFEKTGLNAEDIKIVDGSGVSKNNIITADFMSEFLVKQADCEYFVNSLPTSGEGTLKSRMLYFKDNLRAKTGTLADVSAIAGYITSRSGKTYAFDIMINDAKSKTSDKKSLEEYILRDIYTSY